MFVDLRWNSLGSSNDFFAKYTICTEFSTFFQREISFTHCITSFA